MDVFLCFQAMIGVFYLASCSINQWHLLCLHEEEMGKGKETYGCHGRPG